MLLFSLSVMSDSLRPHELQRACQASLFITNSQSLLKLVSIESTTSSCVIPFSCPQSFPASGSFPMNQLFTSGGQSIGTSASASAFPMNIQGWFPLGLTALISLLFKGLKRFLQHHNLKALILWHSAFFMVQLSYHSFRECFKSVPYWPCYLPLTSSKNMASPCDHRGKDQIHKFKIMLTETTQYVTNMLLLLE